MLTELPGSKDYKTWPVLSQKAIIFILIHFSQKYKNTKIQFKLVTVFLRKWKILSISKIFHGSKSRILIYFWCTLITKMIGLAFTPLIHFRWIETFCRIYISWLHKNGFILSSWFWSPIASDHRFNGYLYVYKV